MKKDFDPKDETWCQVYKELVRAERNLAWYKFENKEVANQVTCEVARLCTKLERLARQGKI